MKAVALERERSERERMAQQKIAAQTPKQYMKTVERFSLNKWLGRKKRG
jgi:hypothetical protein